MQKPIEHFEKNKSTYLDSLCDLVRIPSVSFDGFDPKRVEDSAQKTLSLMKSTGLENTQVIKFPGAHPYVYGEWLKAKGKPTVLLYAHHDVQPPGREEVWKSKPFEPVQKEGRLWGRGAADDKAGIMVHLAAIDSYLKTVGSLPVNVKVLIEGEEETGSEHLHAFLDSHKDLVKADIMILTDTSNFDVGIPSLTVSLRGLVSISVELSALEGTVHSGMWGGPLPDPVMGLCKMLSTLADSEGNLNIPSLMGKLKPLSSKLRASVDKLPYDEKHFRKQAGMLSGSEIVGGDENNFAKMWYKPSVSINAFEASSRKQAGNVICNKAWAKIGIRIVSPLTPEETQTELIKHLKAQVPWGLKLEVETESLGNWWMTEPNGPAFEAATRAMEKGYGEKVAFIGCGGSIPFVQPFSDALGGAPALLVGVEDPMTNAHGENESLHIEDFYKAIKSSIYLFEEIGKL